MEMERKDHSRDRERIEAVLKLLRKQAPLTMKQVRILSFHSEEQALVFSLCFSVLIDNLFFFSLLVLFSSTRVLTVYRRNIATMFVWRGF